MAGCLRIKAAAAEPTYVVNGQPAYSGGTSYQVLPEDGNFAADITVVAEADQSIRLGAHCYESKHIKAGERSLN